MYERAKSKNIQKGVNFTFQNINLVVFDSPMENIVNKLLLS